MNVFMLGRVRFSTLLLTLLAICTSLPMPASAYTFGAGLYSANTYGGATTISISIDKNPSILTTYSNGLFTGSDSHTVTVTSTDIAGYNLYIEDQTTTDMSNGTDTIPTTYSTVPAPLGTNTWGFNTTLSSTNFAKMPTSQTLIKSTNGLSPTNNGGGDGITVTYGVKLDISKGSGIYTTGVIYTAVGKS